MLRTKSFLALISVLGLGLLLGGVVFVQAHGGDTSQIHGCIGVGSGTRLGLGGRVITSTTILRVVGANESCEPNETALDWNKQGPQGLPGTGYNPLQIATLHWYEANQTFPTVTVGINPGPMAFDGSNVWVVNYSSGNVTRLKANDGSVINNYSVGSLPLGIAFDGTNVWIANSGSNNVTKLKTSDGSLVGIYSVGTNPQAVAFDGTNIWVANAYGNSVTKLKAKDGSLVGTYSVGTNPTGLIAFDGTNI